MALQLSRKIPGGLESKRLEAEAEGEDTSRGKVNSLEKLSKKISIFTLLESRIIFSKSRR